MEVETNRQEMEKGVITAGLLNDLQLLDALALVQSYREYWNAKKFKENWDKAFCDLQKVEHLLEEAAEIVIEIRTKLGHEGGDPIEGAAKEYLWSLDALPVPEEFVLDLIHATFKRGDGTYDPPLTKEMLDQLIAEVVHFNSTHKKGESVEGPLVQLYREGSEMETNLLSKWTETNELMKSLAQSEDVKLWTSSLIENLKAIDNSIDIVKHQLNHIKNRRDFKRTKSLNTLLNSRRSARELKRKETERQEKEQKQKKQQQEQEQKQQQEQQDQPGDDKIEIEKNNQIPNQPEETKDEESPVSMEQQQQQQEQQEQQQEQPSQPSPELTKGLLVIEKVHQNADAVDHDIKDLATSVNRIQEYKDNPKEALGMIGALKKKSAIYLDSLMNDLIKLDELNGEGIRAERKREITNVQKIMDGIEALQNQIHKFELEIQPIVQRQEAEEREVQERQTKEKEEAEKIKLIEQQRLKELEQARLLEEAQKARQENLKLSLGKRLEEGEKQDSEDTTSKAIGPVVSEESEEAESPWRKLKLEVDLGVTEKPQAYIITGNVPGMKQSDIRIKVDDNKLTISGFREPSQMDLQQMTRALTSRGFVPKNKNELILALMKIGVGRFGTFQQTYQLPKDGTVDTSKIEAQYIHGVLKVVVPKRMASPIYGKPQPTYNPYKERYAPQRSRGFMQDPSVWW